MHAVTYTHHDTRCLLTCCCPWPDLSHPLPHPHASPIVSPGTHQMDDARKTQLSLCKLSAVQGLLGLSSGGHQALLAVAQLAGGDYDVAGAERVGDTLAITAVKTLLEGQEVTGGVALGGTRAGGVCGILECPVAAVCAMVCKEGWRDTRPRAHLVCMHHQRLAGHVTLLHGCLLHLSITLCWRCGSCHPPHPPGRPPAAGSAAVSTGGGARPRAGGAVLLHRLQDMWARGQPQGARGPPHTSQPLPAVPGGAWGAAGGGLVLAGSSGGRG
jgi:hypothetical protein